MASPSSGMGTPFPVSTRATHSDHGWDSTGIPPRPTPAWVSARLPGFVGLRVPAGPRTHPQVSRRGAQGCLGECAPARRRLPPVPQACPP